MKKSEPAICFVLFALASLLGATTSQAQTLEVRESGSGTGTVNKWQNRWGTYRDLHQTKKIRITVRDMSRRSPDGQLRAYFVARKQPDSDPYIYDHEIVNIRLGGDIEFSTEVQARSLFGNEYRSRSGNIYHYRGATMEGWRRESAACHQWAATSPRDLLS